MKCMACNNECGIDEFISKYGLCLDCTNVFIEEIRKMMDDYRIPHLSRNQLIGSIESELFSPSYIYEDNGSVVLSYYDDDD